jgi:predicted metalloendopeptidase
MWSSLNKNHKVTKHAHEKRKLIDSEFLLDQIDAFCAKQIRETFMVDINRKYYSEVNTKTHAAYIELLVYDIINASSAFFNQALISTPPHPQESDEYKLHIGRRTATKAKLKMDDIVVNSMASVASIEAQLFEWGNTERAVLIDEDYPACWFKSKNLEIAEPSITRTEHFLVDRRNSTLSQMILWKTVKAETVNAWYDPTANSITIPVGITQHPLFRGDYTYDVSFLGSVIGHELGHATDSSGNQFDHIGTYTFGPWWDAKDVEYLNNRTQCIIEDYGSPCGSDEYGHHTLGEDMADQFGLRMVLSLARGLLLETAVNTSQVGPDEVKRLLKEINKDVFINFARVWCGRSTYAQECDNVAHDVHALAKDRVIKTLRQFKTFSDAFGCSIGDPMLNEARCIVY